jgi:hypothetical protein
LPKTHKEDIGEAVLFSGETVYFGVQQSWTGVMAVVFIAGDL